ncbi:carbon-nitrogen hydrolase [Canariomyces notabilis]|uniref:Carbon-nitrogen hydrolase n=1 Tax=Canariomyces notabilis TaxID=2074819 RepID=A0AAN6TBS8_9PEZI|nr:carbon-nitrogen hydrolase [Canariomyces arenarius]
MAPVYKFAIVQLQPKDVAVEENYAKAESYIREAAAQGADLAILPEYHLTSWCPDHPDFIAACKASVPYLARYQALARELGINIVPGTICEIHPAYDTSTTTTTTKDSEIRNMTYWISPAGSLLGSYQKKNLWHPERPHLTAGTVETPHTAFDTPLVTWDDAGRHRPIRAGLLICWDLAFPEAFRALVADGADVVVIPSFWLVRDEDDPGDADLARRVRVNQECEQLFLRSVLVARAFENTAAVVYCNVASGGLSQVVMPVVGAVGGPGGGGGGQGAEGVSVVMGVGEEGVRVVQVDFGLLGLAEEGYKIRKDMMGEGWHYGYTLRKD